MKLLSVVTALPRTPSCVSNACSNTTYSSPSYNRGTLGISTLLLAVISTLTFLVLPAANVYAQSTTEYVSTKKTVTSKEYRYNQPYTGREKAVIKQDGEQADAKQTQHTPSQTSAEPLRTQPSEHKTNYEVNAAYTGSSLNTSSIDSKHAVRVEQHSNTTKSSSDIVLSSVNEFWIYDSWINLQHDLDYDGYFSTFSVEFDADTIFIDAPVYAVLYLGQNGVYDAIHVSSEFYIYGEESSDRFVIESTLVSGFSSYDYDILLELYDAQTEQLVAFSDGYDNPEFAFVPLESETNEYVIEDKVVIVEEHAGSLNWAALLFIIASLSLRHLHIRQLVKK